MDEEELIKGFKKRWVNLIAPSVVTLFFAAPAIVIALFIDLWIFLAVLVFPGPLTGMIFWYLFSNFRHYVRAKGALRSGREARAVVVSIPGLSKPNKGNFRLRLRFNNVRNETKESWTPYMFGREQVSDTEGREIEVIVHKNYALVTDPFLLKNNAKQKTVK